MMLRAMIVIFIILAVAGAAIFIYRYQLVQYSADSLIRSMLPEYVKIDKITFNAKDGKVLLEGFKIMNPKGFSNFYLLEIEEVSCRYRMRGKNLLDGFEIFEPAFIKAVLNIERLDDGRVNLVQMKSRAEKASAAAKKKTVSQGGSTASSVASKVIGDKKPSDIIKLPEDYSVKDGKAIFIDSLGVRRPYLITFENIDAKLSLKFDEDYSRILDLETTGTGNLNGDRTEVVKWAISLDPTAAKLTMSNRLEVSGLDILTFEPYYDKQSPLVFKRGKFSGTLIFDFDNGNIGSTNEIHLSDIQFYIKRGYENAAFWETNVPDLVKYLATPYGEIVFDFKIKGEIANPKFYLGPISKQAITSMAIDKISDAIQRAASKDEPQSAGSTAPKTDLEKAKEYIDLFKGLIQKKE